jgi:prophage maintenance system killer protein
VLFCLELVSAVRIAGRRVAEPVGGGSSPAEDFQHAYPKCSAKLAESGLDLADLTMSQEEVSKLIALPPADCNWWDSLECAESKAEEAAHEYFLRMTLVGQPDPRGPTLYTPKAQEAVVTEMRSILKEKLAEGETNPDLETMARIFREIDVEDTGSVKVEIINAFASVFNRGSADTVYRSKDVKTQLYDLSTWGENMPEKIAQYNTLTYQNKNGTTTKALQLSRWYLLGRHSFVYKLPEGGIESALQNLILDPFVAKSSTMGNPSDMAAFEMAEKWIRNFVILHPYTDSNGRTARVSLNMFLMLNGLVPMVMEKQDEDMTSSPDELRDKICEGMAYAKKLLRDLPEIPLEILSENRPSDEHPFPVQSKDARCCAAADSLNGGEEMCVSVPMGLTCEKYGNLKQSMKYMPWQESASCGSDLRHFGSCSDKAMRVKHIREDTLAQKQIAETKKAETATKLYRMTAYRTQSFAHEEIRNSNLASDIGGLVFMATSIDFDKRILQRSQEIITKRELVLKIAEDKELAAQHYITFKEGQPSEDHCQSCVQNIDTVGVERVEKHMWISLPADLECDENSSPGVDCAWKDARKMKAIRTACLMGMAEKDGEKRVFEQIYKRFTYPENGGGEAALDGISKAILKLFRNAFDTCDDVRLSTVLAVEPKDEGMENRCCCFSEETSATPDWVKNGVCLQDVGERAIFADMWDMIRVPDKYLDDGATDCSQKGAYEGMALYRVDPKLGRCLSHHKDQVTSVTFNHNDASLGGNEDDVTFENVYPKLRRRKLSEVPLASHFINHTYVCDAAIGMHHQGCDCSWIGEECNKPKSKDSTPTVKIENLSDESALPSMFLLMLAASAMIER